MTRTGRLLVLLVLILCVPLLAAWYWPMTNDAQVAEGQRAFRAGDFDRAAQAFRKALLEQGDSDRVQYDLGTALLRSAMGSTDDEQRNVLLDHSIAALRRATDSKETRVRERALYNLGNAFALRLRYEEALASYRKVLLDNADHEDARFNLELVLMVKRQEVPEQRPAASGSNQQGEGEGKGQGPAQEGASGDGQSPANPGDTGRGQGQEASAASGSAQQAGAGQEAAREKELATSLEAQADYAGIDSQAARSMDNLTLVQKLEALERRSGELRRSNLLRKSRERLRDPNKKGSWQ
jgi:tetratricopeptide (TPR) repeat protein